MTLNYFNQLHRKFGKLFMLLCLSVPALLFGQTTVTIGTVFSNTYNYPITRLYDYGTWESVFLQSEIATAGTITTIEFYKGAADDGVNYNNVTVYMQETAATTLSSGAFSTTGYTTVFSGTVTNPSTAAGWVSITLTTPFSYSNSNNLLIAIDKGYQAANGTNPAYWNYCSTGTYMNRRCIQNGSACSASLTATMNRPYIRLTLSSGPANDNCSGASTLTVNSSCSYTAGNATGATASGVSAATCGGVDTDDMWYKFIATATTQTITVAASASYDPVIQLFNGTCASLSHLACRDVGGNGASETMTYSSFTVGNTYYVRVYDWNTAAPASTTFSICVTGTTCAVNITSHPSQSCVDRQPKVDL